MLGISWQLAAHVVCSPLKLIEHVKEVFLKMGGLILEGSGLSKVNIYDDAAVVTYAAIF